MQNKGADILKFAIKSLKNIAIQMKERGGEMCPIMHLSPIYKTVYKAAACELSSSYKFYRGGIEVTISVQEILPAKIKAGYSGTVGVVGRILKLKQEKCISGIGENGS